MLRELHLTCCPIVPIAGFLELVKNAQNQSSTKKANIHIKCRKKANIIFILVNILYINLPQTLLSILGYTIPQRDLQSLIEDCPHLKNIKMINSNIFLSIFTKSVE